MCQACAALTSILSVLLHALSFTAITCTQHMILVLHLYLPCLCSFLLSGGQGDGPERLSGGQGRMGVGSGWGSSRNGGAWGSRKSGGGGGRHLAGGPAWASGASFVSSLNSGASLPSSANATAAVTATRTGSGASGEGSVGMEQRAWRHDQVRVRVH